MDEYNVNISSGLYKNYIESKTNFCLLIRTLEESASLSYDNEYLYFNNEQLDFIFRLLCPEEYNEVFRALKAKAEEQGEV